VKKLKLAEKSKNRIISVGAILSILICAIWYIVSYKYVIGEYQTGWIFYGITFSNYNLSMFVLLAIGACGTIWIIYRYAKNMKLLASVLAALCVALIMAITTIFLYAIPVLVVLTIMIILINERRKKNVSTGNGK